jgi:hypothetical protein
MPMTTVYPELLLLDHFSGYDFVFRSHIADNHTVPKIRNCFIDNFRAVFRKFGR